MGTLLLTAHGDIIKNAQQDLKRGHLDHPYRGRPWCHYEVRVPKAILNYRGIRGIRAGPVGARPVSRRTHQHP